MKQCSRSPAVRPNPRPRLARHALAASIAAAFGTAPAPAWAQLPTNGQVVNGNAGITTDGNQMTVTNSPNAVINWDSFSIDAGYGVHFQQESAASKVLNQVVGNNPSNIFGSLSSNGAVWLINPNGMLFGSTARVNVAGLVASTLPLSTADFLAGQYRFGGGGPAAIRTEPESEIGTTFGGHVVLIAASIENGGTIGTTAGHTILAAASSLELVDSGVPNLTVRISGPANTVTNLGSLLTSDGGTIDVLGGIVNQQGIVRAETLSFSTPGRVSIQGQEGVSFSSGSQTDADGSGTASGGVVTVESTNGSIMVAGNLGATSGSDDNGAGDGGSLLVRGKSVTVMPGAELSVAGLGSGGTLSVEAADGAILVQGRLSAFGVTDSGGDIGIGGRNVGVHGPAVIDASGYAYGGSITLDRAAATPAGATSSVYVGPNALLQASTQQGSGGSIYIGQNSDATRVYGTLEATGGTGSFGGFVETSGQFVAVRARRIDVSGGAASGRWWAAAGDITIDADSATPPVDTVTFDVPAATDAGRVSASLVSQVLTDGADVSLGADFERELGPPPLTRPGNIVVASDIAGNATGHDGFLDLTARNDLILNPGVSIASSAGPLHVTLLKDMDANDRGSIELGAGSRIATAGGDVILAGSSRRTESFVPVPRLFIGGEIDAGAGTIDVQSTSLELANARLSSSATGSPIWIKAREFSSAGSALTASNGRWLMFLDRGASFTAASLADLNPSYVQVNSETELAPTNENGVLLTDSLDVRAKVNAGREYDGSTNARFSEVLTSDAPFGFRYATGSDGAFSVDGRFQDKNVGVDKPVSYDGDGLPFRLETSTGVPVYGAETSFTADITPRILALSSLTAADKVYDATRTATVNAGLSNVVGGDDIALGGLAGLFDTKNAGTGKTVVVTAGSLQGADAFNYALPGPATTTADITPRPITAQGIVGADKVYDGTRNASISGGSFAGILAGDDLTVGTGAPLFDNKNAGTNKLITFTGSVSGVDAQNYILAGELTARASITPRPLQIGIAGQVGKEYDASASASLRADQYVLNGAVANDALTVSGPTLGSYDSPNVGQQKGVTASGSFDIAGADAPNYRVGAANLGSAASNAVAATASGNVGTITPATLFYQATPAVRTTGLPLSGFDGTVTGWRGADTVATATTGNLLWTGAATPASPPGAYAIEGSGLLASNYVFAQAPGNANALVLEAPAVPPPPPVPAAPVEIARESSTASFNTALHAAVAAIDPPGIAGGVFDISGPAAGRSFAPVRIGSLNQNELLAMLEERRDFKRKLFADAIYKLEIDPSLANVQPCASIVEAKTGACRITRAQLELGRGSQAQAAAVIRKAAKSANLPQIERKIALLIGINEYRDRTIPRLENALPDVDALGALFADKLGYEVRVLRDPGKADIIRSLNQLSLEIGSSDSVIVYYAGHGYSLEKNGAGYWLPADALASDPRQWISNSDIAQLLAGVRSQQMALISDSCYSGAFARDGMDAVGVNVSADEVLTKRSVVVLSSGGDEPVADEGKDNHSIFAWNLMQVVNSVSNWKPGSTIFTEVQAGVKKDFPQTPKYGSVTAAGHQRGGDYLFELRGKN